MQTEIVHELEMHVHNMHNLHNIHNTNAMFIMLGKKHIIMTRQKYHLSTVQNSTNCRKFSAFLSATKQMKLENMRLICTAPR